MKLLAEGTCHCSKNQFTITGDAEYQFVCYCEGCRHINSGGHLCGALFDSASLSEAAHTKSYTYCGGSGKEIVLHFCQNCGTHLYAFPKAFENKVVIRVNTLADFDFSPQQDLFKESAFSWDK